MKSPRGAGKDAGAPTGATRAPRTAERGIYSAPPYAATAPGGLKSALPGHFRSRRPTFKMPMKQSLLTSAPTDLESSLKRVTRFGAWNLGFLWCLELGTWSFSGVWCLVFSIGDLVFRSRCA